MKLNSWANWCWTQFVPAPVQVVAELPANWRHAIGDVNHAWLMGAVGVPSMTLFVTWATLLRVIVVTPLARLPAPILTSHWAKPAPFAKPMFASAVTAK